MAVVGETMKVPVGPMTVPTPWSMLSEVALVLVQLRTAFCPAATLVGVAVSVTPSILTVALAVAVRPAAPVATAV